MAVKIDRIWCANGPSSVQIINQASPAALATITSRFFDSDGAVTGDESTYDGNAYHCVHFYDAVNDKDWLVFVSILPTQRPPFVTGGLLDVSAEGTTIPRVQEFVVPGQIEDITQLPRYAAKLIYHHVINTRHIVTIIDGFQEGAIVTPPTGDFYIICDNAIIGRILPCSHQGPAGGVPNFDPEFITGYIFNEATQQLDQLYRRGTPEPTTSPALRHLVGIGGHVYISETVYDFGFNFRTLQFELTPIRTGFFYVWHADTVDPLDARTPFRLVSDATNLWWTYPQKQAILEVDSDFYAYFAHAEVGVEATLDIHQLVNRRISPNGPLGYRHVKALPEASVTFPNSLPAGALIASECTHILKTINHIFIFYMVHLAADPTDTWTPVMTVYDVTTRTAPVHRWDVDFPTLKTTDGTVKWVGLPRPIWDLNYIYISTSSGIAVIDWNDADVSEPSLVTNFAAFGNIRNPATGADTGTPMPVEPIGLAIDESAPGNDDPGDNQGPTCTHSPLNGQVNIPPDVRVIVTFKDQNGGAVDDAQTSIAQKIFPVDDSLLTETVYAGGAFQAGYSGIKTAVAAGFEYEWTRDLDYPNESLVRVLASACDDEIPANCSECDFEFSIIDLLSAENDLDPLMECPCSLDQDALMDLFRRITPRDYWQNLTPLSGKEIFLVLAKVFERCCEAISRTFCPLYIYVASGARFSQAFLTISRTDTTNTEIFKAGSKFIADNGLLFSLDDDLTLNAGNAGPILVETTCDRAGWHGDQWSGRISKIGQLAQGSSATIKRSNYTVALNEDGAGGRYPVLDWLGLNRGLNRMQTETDVAYRRRLARLPETVAPRPILNTVNKVLTTQGFTKGEMIEPCQYGIFCDVDVDPGDPLQGFEAVCDLQPGEIFDWQLIFDADHIAGAFMIDLSADDAHPSWLLRGIYDYLQQAKAAGVLAELHQKTPQLPLARIIADGTTASYSVTNPLAVDGTLVFKGGMYQKLGASNDYTISGRVVTFTPTPAAGVPLDIVQVRDYDAMLATRESFVGDGATTNFVLANTPVTDGDFVWKGGVFQRRGGSDDYTLTGATIAFLTAPIAGTNVEVYYLRQLVSSINLNRQPFMGDGATKDFKLTSRPLPDGLFVFAGGQHEVAGSGNGYVLALNSAGETLVRFATAPILGINVEARYFS